MLDLDFDANRTSGWSLLVPPPQRLYFKDKNKCFPSSFRNVKLCRVPFLLTVVCRQPHCTYCCEDELCGTLSHASARSNKFRLWPQCARRGLWAGSQAWQWKSSLQQFAGKPTARVPLAGVSHAVCLPPTVCTLAPVGARRACCPWSCPLAEGRGCGCS